MKRILLIVFIIAILTVSCQNKINDLTRSYLSLYFIQLGYYSIDSVENENGDTIKYMYKTSDINCEDRLIFTPSLFNHNKINVKHEREYLSTGKVKTLWRDSFNARGDFYNDEKKEEEIEAEAKRKIKEIVKKFNSYLK